MIITYFGEQFFKITQGELVLAFNPVGKDAKSSATARFGADISLVSARNSLFSGVEQVTHGDRFPFIINGPGDYEVKEIFIKGAMSSITIDEKKCINTIYSFTLENINVVFLGALGDEEISKDTREAMGTPDILFVPIGGSMVNKGMKFLNPEEAAKLALSLEAKMIIPMSYNDATLKVFLKEMSEDKAEVVEKLTLKSKDLEGKEGDVVVLKAVK